MKRFGAMSLFALAMMLFASMAWAQAAYILRDSNLRAGPSRDYPLIAQLPAGYQITVVGCLSGYVWCDVIAGPSRGWLYAGNIRYLYGNAYVPVREYGPRIGIAVIGFVLGNYWAAHYRHRPWYSERHRWSRKHPVPYRPARPSHRPNLHRAPPPPRHHVPLRRHDERSMHRAPAHRGAASTLHESRGGVRNEERDRYRDRR